MWSNSHFPLGQRGVDSTTSANQPSRSVPSTGPWTTSQPDGAFSTHAALPAARSPDESHLTTHASDLPGWTAHQASSVPGSQSASPHRAPLM